MDAIGPSRFCATVCDSTGNTRLSRALVAARAPTVLNLADIIHHFSLTLKDIAQLDFFKHVCHSQHIQ